MKYYRCKCGFSEAYGSMSPSRCTKCKKCGSNLAGSPDSHIDPTPHELVAYPIESDQGGATLSRCKWCRRTKKQLGI